MNRNTHFDPTLVRQTIRLAEEMEIARLGGHNALPAARERFIQFVANLTSREASMLAGVMFVGAGASSDLEDAIETASTRLDSRPVLAMCMAEDNSLATHLSDGLRNLLISAPEV